MIDFELITTLCTHIALSLLVVLTSPGQAQANISETLSKLEMFTDTQNEQEALTKIKTAEAIINTAECNEQWSPEKHATMKKAGILLKSLRPEIYCANHHQIKLEFLILYSNGSSFIHSCNLNLETFKWVLENDLCESTEDNSSATS